MFHPFLLYYSKFAFNSLIYANFNNLFYRHYTISKFVKFLLFKSLYYTTYIKYNRSYKKEGFNVVICKVKIWLDWLNSNNKNSPFLSPR